MREVPYAVDGKAIIVEGKIGVYDADEAQIVYGQQKGSVQEFRKIILIASLT
jgi:hypothetical protein